MGILAEEFPAGTVACCEVGFGICAINAPIIRVSEAASFMVVILLSGISQAAGLCEEVHVILPRIA
jgi:hypothetical protein